MINTYYIGGSPCGGKSTVAEILSKKYNLYYFAVDDFLDNYMEMAASKGYEICTKITQMTSEEIWMRDPVIQCEEEFKYYEEVFEFIFEDLEQIKGVNGIITEGTAYVPKLMKKINIPCERYISITPTPEFQVFHYSKREFVPYILKDCSDKKEAFNKWMNRDILFAKEVQRQCGEDGYRSFINDGKKTVDELVEIVSTHFGLGCENV